MAEELGQQVIVGIDGLDRAQLEEEASLCSEKENVEANRNEMRSVYCA